MDLKALLEAVKNGKVSVEAAAEELSSYDDMGFARVDSDRKRRTGFPEVIFCQEKAPVQAALIAADIAARGENVLATRALKIHYDAIK